MSSYIRDVYEILESILDINSSMETSPPLANLMFLGACYMIAFPEMRWALRRRFLKKTANLLCFVGCVCATSFLVMVTAATQARGIYCRYLKPLLKGVSNEKQQVLGVMLVSFFVVFDVFLSRSVKKSAKDMMTTFKNLKSSTQQTTDALDGVGGSNTASTKMMKRVLRSRNYLPPFDWQKMTRNGTVYGDYGGRV
ncbi:hypothetical protein LOTGIDRAFT_228030 [Lottia gigantea]|uniref:Uncharacterized protein n=1 Tax=Lottia gigantea TaxID=225164 RepID=V4AMP2_LOTGI|nr:hypothetical protein LOTGIDRAFT_228030 [Lottia gigantea]ESP05449.1 hypothetical protein LOTGIDRAFT_228030 [Lottia gigantea]